MEVYEDDPKTDSGARTIALDSATVTVLKAHREQQEKDRAEWGTAWVETATDAPSAHANGPGPIVRGRRSSLRRPKTAGHFR